MTEVHAPYHFAPLSRWVYMPEWAHLVSHDVPFKDGYSGVIHYTFSNRTALCVGGQQTADKPAKVKWQRDPEGNPVIPGSSLKGMLRNHLDIATFAKMRQVDDQHLSYRDISTGKTEYAQEIHDTNAQAYWIKFDPDAKRWQFKKAEHTVLFHADLNRYAHINIKNKDAVPDKYHAYSLTQPAVPFRIGEQTMEGTKRKPVKVECATDLGQGAQQGIPVFSGFRPGRKEYQDKRLNFSYLFYNEAQENTDLPREEAQQLVTKLFNSHDPALVDYLKNHPHPTFGIPVFAREQAGKIVALGFAKMPRKLYPQSIKQTVKSAQPLSESDAIFDLPELLFGTLREQGFSLKSRVYFADATCSLNQGFSDSNPVILGAPKASFLPNYIEQHTGENPTTHTLNHYQKEAIPKGWKRYPTQAQFNHSSLPDNLKDKRDVQSQLELLAPDSQFAGKIVFHNLKRQEIGALLWALQFKDPEGKVFYHSLGHGKPLGAGAISFSDCTLDARPNQTDDGEPLTIEQAVDEFVAHMNHVYQASHEGENNWQHSPQVRHLFAFGDLADNQDKNLTYMPLESKGAAGMSYQQALQGHSKDVLPDWYHGGTHLPRKSDQPKPAAGDYKNFGQGRLADLVSQLPLTDREQQLRATADEQAEAERKASAFAQLSPLKQQFMQLEHDLALPEVRASQDRRRDYVQAMDELLDACLADPTHYDFVPTLLALCRDTSKSAYLDLAKNKKNKLKLAARKKKLAGVETKYK